MSSNIEVNASAAQVVIARQLIDYARTEYPRDQELIGMLVDMLSAARRLHGWLKFLIECQQRVKVMYTEFVSRYFREES